jgi:voltage-gated potassium channel
VTDTDDTATRITLWQMVLLVLSLYVLSALFALFAQTVWSLPTEVGRLLVWIDNAICVIFLGDFFYHLAHAPDRFAYLKWGWVDFISSIPGVDVLRWGRALRVLRILRAIRSVRVVLAIVFARRAFGTFATTTVASFLLVVFAAIAILNLETGTAGKMRTASDALWWAFEMLISQGSGSFNPVSIEGRLLGAALSIAGFVLLGTFIAAISTAVLGEEEEKIAIEEAEILVQLRAVETRLAVIDRRLGAIEQHLDGVAPGAPVGPGTPGTKFSLLPATRKSGAESARR